MYIYRIENDKRVGPYAGDAERSWTKRDHNTEAGCPAPNEDTFHREWDKIQKDIGIHCWFGFSSIKQFHRWFTPKEVIELKKLGFNLIKIPADDVLVLTQSDKQIVFKYKAKVSGQRSDN